MKYILGTIFILISILINAQIGLNQDSLEQILLSNRTDSEKVKTVEILLIPYYSSDLTKTHKSFETGIDISKKNKFLEDEITLNIQWAQLCEMSGDYEQAVDHQKKATKIALENGNIKKLKEILNHVLHYRTETLKAIRDKERLTKQRNIAYLISSIVVAFLLLIIVLISRKNLKRQKSDNQILTKQKNIIEGQKRMVDEKQKEILDSIHYAKRIQTALITSEKYFDKSLKRLGKNTI